MGNVGLTTTEMKWQGSVGHRSYISEWSTAKKAKCALFYLGRLGTYPFSRACQKPIFPSIRMSPNSEADTYL